MAANEGIHLKIIRLPRNDGLGNALSIGLENCENELVARMDSDDVSLPLRFERQLELFTQNPDVDIVGGQITEFVGQESNIVGRRQVKLTDGDIKKDMRTRCPLNHMSVMYKKASVARAGGYQGLYHNEDYLLWINMMLSDAKFANIPHDLVNVRVGEDMSRRRGGMRYFKSEMTLQRLMLKHGIIDKRKFLANSIVRFGGEVAAPNWLRERLFRLTREKCAPEANDQTELKQGVLQGSDGLSSTFSVLMSVYKGDIPEYVGRALDSIVNQSVKPNEIVLVVDGPISTELDSLLADYQTRLSR